MTCEMFWVQFVSSNLSALKSYNNGRLGCTLIFFDYITEPHSQTQAEYVALWVQTLLYGLYIVLFSVCMYIFYTRKTRGHRVLFLAAIAMFTLSTAHVIVDLIIGIFDLLFAIRMSGMINPALSITNPVVYITNNIIADGLLIYRCYVVWGYSRTIVLVPILTLMATTALGYSFGSGEIPFSFGFAGTNRLPSYMAFFCLSLATNVIVTALTAGRIWFISRQTRDGSGKHAIKHYHTAIAIVLESGAIYSIIGFVIIYAALAQIVVSN
ncbi:hypothetical protein BD779DRAFT_1499810 [Infundibulicybe gibba]|nr:hypothetical protein BD779DRAFT_1499810 [Infundibulicybe gibba]